MTSLPFSLLIAGGRTDLLRWKLKRLFVFCRWRERTAIVVVCASVLYSLRPKWGHQTARWSVQLWKLQSTINTWFTGEVYDPFANFVYFDMWFSRKIHLSSHVITFDVHVTSHVWRSGHCRLKCFSHDGILFTRAHVEKLWNLPEEIFVIITVLNIELLDISLFDWSSERNGINPNLYK